jgi:hypothetical protein
MTVPRLETAAGVDDNGAGLILQALLLIVFFGFIFSSL